MPSFIKAFFKKKTKFCFFKKETRGMRGLRGVEVRKDEIKGSFLQSKIKEHPRLMKIKTEIDSKEKLI